MYLALGFFLQERTISRSISQVVDVPSTNEGYLPLLSTAGMRGTGMHRCTYLS